ncbi:MAG: hypothetical protein MJ089_03625 [Ruminococcus sp.]|nr:hypothetical protein [Ruminococcus sp.]
MKMNKKYFKSKKGLSLAELLCAVCIMAIAVAAASSGLSVAYTAILDCSARDQAASNAQRACDIIMTIVEHTPSNDPDCPIADPDQQAKNLLFNEYDFKYKLDDFIFYEICNGIIVDGATLDIDMLEQVDNANNHDWNKGSYYFTIKKAGSYAYTLRDTTENKTMITYEITAYYDYGKNNVASCVGSVSKLELAE